MGDFKAQIDGGDGTPLTAGTVSAGASAGTFTVSGTHTYADSGVTSGSGQFPIQVFVTDVDGASLTVSNTAVVADRPIVLNGRLNVASDSGWYAGDMITNVTQPNFYGLSEPYSHVWLFANGVYDGLTQADGAGHWSITSEYLPDGTYTITAASHDQFGLTSAGPVTLVSNLVVDTVGPRITYAAFNASDSTATFVFQDVLGDGTTPGGSGLLYRSLFDSANHALTKVPGRTPGNYVVTNLHILPGPNPESQEVIVVFNNGAYNKQGAFELTVYARSPQRPSGIQDVAGNALDGEYYGKQDASGNGVPGGNFVADFSIEWGKSPKGPSTIIGYSHPSPAPPLNPPPTPATTVKHPIAKLAQTKPTPAESAASSTKGKTPLARPAKSGTLKLVLAGAPPAAPAAVHQA